LEKDVYTFKAGANDGAFNVPIGSIESDIMNFKDSKVGSQTLLGIGLSDDSRLMNENQTDRSKNGSTHHRTHRLHAQGN
jgi:hypothetical protein